MEKKHFSEEQIAFVLRQAESGTSVAEIIRKLGGSVNDPQLSHKHWYKNWGGVRHVESVAVATRHTLDEIDLEAATAETNRPGRCEPLPLDNLPHFEAGFGSLPDQHFGLGHRHEHDRVGISRRPRLPHHAAAAFYFS
jgi:hypothetical protein